MSVDFFVSTNILSFQFIPGFLFRGDISASKIKDFYYLISRFVRVKSKGVPFNFAFYELPA